MLNLKGFACLKSWYIVIVLFISPLSLNYSICSSETVEMSTEGLDLKSKCFDLWVNKRHSSVYAVRIEHRHGNVIICELKVTVC